MRRRIFSSEIYVAFSTPRRQGPEANPLRYGARRSAAAMGLASQGAMDGVPLLVEAAGPRVPSFYVRNWPLP
jgi:hypothetical protein